MSALSPAAAAPPPASNVRAALRQLAVHSIVYGAGSVIVRAAGILVLPLYTRFLTPADYGIIAVATTVTALLAVVYPLGLHGAIAFIYYKKDDEDWRSAASTTLWLTSLLTAAVFTAGFEATRGAFLPGLFEHVPYAPYLRLSVWTALFTTASAVPLALWQAQQRSALYVAATSANTFVLIGCILWFVAVRNDGAYGYLVGALIASVAMSVVYAAIVIRDCGLRLRRDALGPALNYSLPLVPHGIAGWALGMADRVVLERFVPLASLGLYALAAQFAAVMTLVATAVNTAWVPMLFKTHAERGEAAHRESARLVTYYAIAMAWLALAVMLLLKPAILLATDAKFHASHVVGPWLVIAWFLNSLYFFPANLMFVYGRTALLPLATIAAGVAGVSINVLLAPRFGIFAAAWGNCVAYALLLVLVWAAARRACVFPYEYGRIARVLVATGLVAIAGFSISISSLLVETVWRVFAIAAFPVVLWLTGTLSLGERQGLKAVVLGFWSRSNVEI